MEFHKLTDGGCCFIFSSI